MSKQFYLDRTRNSPELRHNTLREAARIVGYRLLPAELHYPSRIERGKPALLTSFWENRGAARPGARFGILFALIDRAGGCVWKQLTHRCCRPTPLSGRAAAGSARERNSLSRR